MTDTSKHQILVVDDEPSIRECLAILLAEAGYEVTTAEHGFDALLQLRILTPTVIISDLNMPQMSGFELLSILRRRSLKLQLLLSAAPTGPAITSVAKSSRMRSKPRGSIPKSSYRWSPNRFATGRHKRGTVTGTSFPVRTTRKAKV